MTIIEALIPLAAILVGGAIILVPIVGITARFALKPAVEAFTRLRAGQGAEERNRILEQRVALLEEQLHAMERQQQRLLDESEFSRQLRAPGG